MLYVCSLGDVYKKKWTNWIAEMPVHIKMVQKEHQFAFDVVKTIIYVMRRSMLFIQCVYFIKQVKVINVSTIKKSIIISVELIKKTTLICL